MFDDMAPPPKPKPKVAVSLESLVKRGEQVRSLIVTGFAVGLALVLVVGAVATAWSARDEWVVTVAPLRVPDTLKPRGLSGEVLAHRLLAQINDIREDGFFVNLDAGRSKERRDQDQASDAKERPLRIDYGTDWSAPKFDIAIPGAGLSFDQAVDGLRRVFRAREVSISGDLVAVSGSTNPGGEQLLRITLKIDGLSAPRVIQRTFDASRIDAELTALTPRLLSYLDPVALARHYINAGDFNDADNAIDSCLAADIRDCGDAEKASALLLRAGRLQQSGRGLEAIAAANEALTKNLDRQDRITAFQILGLARYGRSEYTEAIAAFRQALALDAGNWTTTEGYFTALKRSGQIDAARDLMLAGLRLQIGRALAGLSGRANVETLKSGLLERQKALAGPLQAPPLLKFRSLAMSAEGSAANLAALADTLRAVDYGLRQLAGALKDPKFLAELIERSNLKSCFSGEPLKTWPTGKLLYCARGMLGVSTPEAAKMNYEAAADMLAEARQRSSDALSYDPAIVADVFSIPGVGRSADSHVRILREETDTLGQLESDLVYYTQGEEERIRWYLAVQYLRRYLVRRDRFDFFDAETQIDRLTDANPASEKYRAAAAALRLTDGICDGLAPAGSEPSWTLLSPAAPTVHMYRGMFQACLKNFDAALTELDSAITALHSGAEAGAPSRDMAKLQTVRATTEHASAANDFDAAVAAQLDYALDADSTWPEPHDEAIELARGSLYEMLARPDQAIASYSVAYNGEPNPAAATAYARMLSEAGRYGEAVDVIQGFLEIGEPSRELLAILGEAQLALDRLDQAEINLNDVWRSDTGYYPDDEQRSDAFSLRLQADLAILAVRQRRPDEAIRKFKLVLWAMPDDQRANLELIKVYCSTGQLQEARSALLSARAHDVKDLPAEACGKPAGQP